MPGAVFSEPDLSSGIADAIVATASADQASDPAPVVDVQEEATAEADLSGLGHVGEEHSDRPADLSTPSEPVQAEDTSEARSGEDSGALGLVKAEVEVEDPPAEASDPAVASATPDSQQSGFSKEPVAVGSPKVSEPAVTLPKPEVADTPSFAAQNPDLSVDIVASEAPEVSVSGTVADTSSVATASVGFDASDFSAPPTSPNIAGPGVEPIRTGHSPSAPSSGPRQRTRQRGSRGGQTTRNQEAIRSWYSDLDTVRAWLYENSGGRSGRGFWLGKCYLDRVDLDQRWQVANYQALVE